MNNRPGCRIGLVSYVLVAQEGSPTSSPLLPFIAIWRLSTFRMQYIVFVLPCAVSFYHGVTVCLVILDLNNCYAPCEVLLFEIT